MQWEETRCTHAWVFIRSYLAPSTPHWRRRGTNCCPGCGSNPASPDKTPKYGTVRVSTPKSDAPDLSEKVQTEFMPIYERQPGFNTFASIRTDDG
jgi:hypothetical protein